MRHAGLDSLRLCAAALVLFAHAGALLFTLWPHYDLYLLAGLIGVEAFFALSGFLLAGLLLADPPRGIAQAGGWMIDRLRRVLPGYWLFVLLNLLLWLGLHGGFPDAVWRHVLLWQNSAAPPGPFHGESWNLPILVLFWLLAPLLAGWAARRPHPVVALRNALFVLALLGLLLRGGLVIAVDPAWDEGVRKWLPMRLDACAWGGIAACLVAEKPGRARGLAWLGVALLLETVWVFATLPRDGAAARVLLFALVAAGGAAILPSLMVGRSAAWLTAAARACFALYLVNMPLMLLMLAWRPAWLGVLPATALWLLASLVAALALERGLLRRWR